MAVTAVYRAVPSGKKNPECACVRAVPPGQQQSKSPGAEHMQIPTPTTWYTRLESGSLGWWAPAGEHTDPRAGTCAGAAVALRASGVWAVVAASRGCTLHSAALRAHRHDRTSRVFYTDRWGQTGRSGTGLPVRFVRKSVEFEFQIKDQGSNRFNQKTEVRRIWRVFKFKLKIKKIKENLLKILQGA
jgi:hypothetical protein